jgi:multiple sugar transport system substrate-binding protein
MPIMTETLKLMKQMYDSCVTKNWSGIPGTSGAVVGLQQFVSGKAAMAWGVDFGYGVVASTPFKVASMPFPTITSATTRLSKNAPAEWGASTGGTDYMIPSNVSGKKYQAALRFLQFVSSPHYIQAWLNATGGVPAIKGATAPPATSGLVSGAWSNTQKVGAGPKAPPTVQPVTEYDIFLLGDRSLSSEESYLQTLWDQGASYNVDNDGWQNESWAKRIER